MTREIPLTQGKVAIVDDEDFAELVKYRWCAIKSYNTYYAVRNSPRSYGKRHTIRMHAVILNPPQGMIIDHINGNGLDNRRENLRVVTTRQNQQNLHIPKSSRYPGVIWYKQTKRWQARIKINGRSKHLGYFKDEFEAATVYRVAHAVLVEVL